MVSLLWLVFVALLVLWLIGVAVDWGALVWASLLAALVTLLANLVGGRRGTPPRRWS